MFDIDGSKRAPADLFVPRNKTGNWKNVAAVCSALGLPVMREDIVKEIDRKSAHLTPTFWKVREERPLEKRNPEAQFEGPDNQGTQNHEARRPLAPNWQAKVALANLAQVFADEEDLCRSLTQRAPRKRSDFVDLPKALQPTRELFDSFPQPDPRLKIKLKDA